MKKTDKTLQRRSKNIIAMRFRFGIFFSVIGFYSTSLLLSSDQSLHSNRHKLLNLSSQLLNTANPTLFMSSNSRNLLNYEDKNEMNLKADFRTPNCTPPSINEFPSDGLNRTQRQNGWIVIHISIVCYCFWFLAIICDDYFVPAIEQICLKLEMEEDVVGATFMAAATSSPELFINCVGTFITQGDIGVGTIVGSSVFNILAVPACCGLFTGQMTNLDWWPVTRDCMMYCLAVLGLLCTLYDGIVMWYEGLFLALSYFLYISVLYWNDVMARKARKLISMVKRKSRVRPFRIVDEITPLLCSISKENKFNQTSAFGVNYLTGKEREKNILITQSLGSAEIGDCATDPWNRRESCVLTYLFRWPIILALWITMPDSRRHPRWRFLTFTTSIVWIGAISYTIAYGITIIDYIVKLLQMDASLLSRKILEYAVQYKTIFVNDWNYLAADCGFTLNWDLKYASKWKKLLYEVIAVTDENDRYKFTENARASTKDSATTGRHTTLHWYLTNTVGNTHFGKNTLHMEEVNRYLNGMNWLQLYQFCKEALAYRSRIHNENF